MFSNVIHYSMLAFWWLACLFVTGTAAWAILRLYHGLRMNYLAWRITTPLGCVRLTEENIRGMRIPARLKLMGEPFPAHLNRYIRRLTEADLGRYCMESLTKEATPARLDIYRAITISAAMYGLVISHRVFLLDGRTAALHRVLRAELEPVFVKNEPTQLDGKECDLFKSSPTMELLTMARYRLQMPRMVSVLVHFANQGAYPSFEHFAKTFLQNVRRVNKTNSFDDSEIRSMVTAYAIMSSTMIPRSYVLVNSLTQALVKAPAGPSKPIISEVAYEK